MVLEINRGCDLTVVLFLWTGFINTYVYLLKNGLEVLALCLIDTQAPDASLFNQAEWAKLNTGAVGS